jgi:gamma-glutamylcyclotransferase (GGCT)/AIG2-like uncharacterized protein YtfP
MTLAAEAGFHLFTYGTLKSAMSSPTARELLRDCEVVARGTVRGTLYDAGEYPALLLNGGTAVDGEVWRCPASLLRVLDLYEGTREGLFRRVAVEVAGRPCWIFVAGPKLGPRLRPDAIIESGTWTG